MNQSILYANSTLAAREKIKFTDSIARRLFSAATAEDAAKILVQLGYETEHEEEIIAKKLAGTIDLFVELCPDENLKKFVLTAAARGDVQQFFPKLKNLPNTSLLYIEEYFGKGVTALPPTAQTTAFDLASFVNWFIMKLEEIRVVKAILIGKRLGIPSAQLRVMIRGGK